LKESLIDKDNSENMDSKKLLEDKNNGEKIYIYDSFDGSDGYSATAALKKLYPTRCDKVDPGINYKEKNVIIIIYHSTQSPMFFGPKGLYTKFQRDNFSEAKRLFIVFPTNDSKKYWQDYENGVKNLGPDIEKLISKSPSEFTCTVWGRYYTDLEIRFGPICKLDYESTNLTESKKQPRSHTATNKNFSFLAFLCVPLFYLLKGFMFFVLFVAMLLIVPLTLLMTILLKLLMQLAKPFNLEMILSFLKNFMDTLCGILSSDPTNKISVHA